MHYLFNRCLDKSNTTCYISVSKNIISSYNAKNLSKVINEKFSGKGGGSETFATSILTKIKMDELKKYIKEILK
jgi:alanyl-tRNA synthetase